MKKIFLFIGVLFIASCKPESEVEDLIVCETGTIDFVNEVLPIMQSSCATTGCHDASTAKDGVVLEDYNSIVNTGGVTKGTATSSELYEVLYETGEDKMPPTSSGIVLNQTQKDIIRKWIDQGANNVECTNFETCDTNSFTFSANVKPLLDANCVSCHSSGNSNGVYLSNYGEVKFELDSGKLYSSIIQDGNASAMPQGGTKWDDCKISILTKWINNGALND